MGDETPRMFEEIHPLPATELANRHAERAYCPCCQCERHFDLVHIDHRRFFVLSLSTLGLWLIPWCGNCLGRLLRPHRCRICGWHKPEFRFPKRKGSSTQLLTG